MDQRDGRMVLCCLAEPETRMLSLQATSYYLEDGCCNCVHLRRVSVLTSDAARAACGRQASRLCLHHSLEPHASCLAVPGAVHGYDASVLEHHVISQDRSHLNLVLVDVVRA